MHFAITQSSRCFLQALFLLGLGFFPTLTFALQEVGTTRVSSKTADDGLSLRKIRRVGVGAVASGAYGVAGVQLELNFTPEASTVVGFGTGDRYQSFVFQMKRMLGGATLMPYGALGFARWYTTTNGDGPYNRSTPSFLAKEFLNARQVERGQFAENFVFPAIGVQYLQLSGKYAGLSVFSELEFLIDIGDISAAPTGSVGFSYLF